MKTTHLKLIQQARGRRFLREFEVSFTGESLAIAAEVREGALQTWNLLDVMDNYPLYAITVTEYQGFRIVLGAGLGFEKLITIKNHN